MRLRATLVRLLVPVLGLLLALGLAPAPVASAATGASCRPALSAADTATLLRAADTSQLRSIRDVRERLGVVNDVLAARGDARGAFPLVYAVIVDETITSLERGIFDDPAWAERLAVRFAAEYLRNLDGHLRGSTTTAYWREYYRLASDCTRSPGRVVGTGIVTHLVDDLPRVLKEIGTKDSHYADFELYGEALVQATPRIISTFEASYGVDLSGLFKLYFVGDLVGSGAVTTLFFQTVRNVAWADFLVLRRSQVLGTLGIATVWTAGSTAIAVLEHAGGL